MDKITTLGSGSSKSTGLFGLDTELSAAKLLLYPIPWEATASYGRGASLGPQQILRASQQLDLEDMYFERFDDLGIAMAAENSEIKDLNRSTVALVDSVRDTRSKAKGDNPSYLERINAASKRVNTLVYEETKAYLEAGKLLGCVGGDHSAPYGFIRALAETVPSFGLLHIDAHLDLRESYEGFSFSHASIMYNVLESIPNITDHVAVGIRDFCRFERNYAQNNSERIKVFSDSYLSRSQFKGVCVHEIVEEIHSHLPEQVYISLDIDGLDVRFCPGTGTPVPGGLDFRELVYLIEELVISKRRLIGFDICEVASKHPQDEWNGNVASRLIYKLFGALSYSAGLIGGEAY